MYQVAIRNNQTDEVKVCLVESEWGTEPYMSWSFGENSCDCARGELFDGEKAECGDTVFGVEWIEAEGEKHTIDEDDVE